LATQPPPNVPAGRVVAIVKESYPLKWHMGRVASREYRKLQLGHAARTAKFSIVVCRSPKLSELSLAKCQRAECRVPLQSSCIGDKMQFSLQLQQQREWKWKWVAESNGTLEWPFWDPPSVAM